MSAKKTTKKKIGPGRGGKRPGAGRKPLPGSKTAVISVRVTDAAKKRIAAAANTRGMTSGELVQEWADSM